MSAGTKIRIKINTQWIADFWEVSLSRARHIFIEENIDPSDLRQIINRKSAKLGHCWCCGATSPEG